MSTAPHSLVRDIGSTVNLSLVLATVWVINNDDAKFATSCWLLGQYSTEKSSHWHQSDLLEAVLIRALGIQNKRKDMNTKFLVTSKSNKKYNQNQSVTRFYRRTRTRNQAVWFVDSLAAFDQLEADLLDNQTQFSRNGFFCIVYTGLQPDRLEHIRIIFLRLFTLYVTNVNVLLTIDSVPVALTFFPFSYTKCHYSKPEIYFSFKGIREGTEFIENKPFFPSKVTNMYGCQVIVTTWNNPPFIIKDKTEENPNLQNLHGIEGRLLLLLAQQMNFSIKIVAPELRDNGYVFDNGTLTGATKMIADGETNITLGGSMYEARRAEVMDAAIAYLTSPVDILMPKGALLTPFERLTKPFQHSTWYCFSSSLVIGVLFIFWVKSLRRRRLYSFVFGYNNRTPFTNLWNILFGGILHGRLPRRNLARFLLGLFLFYTFVIRTAYIAELYTMLQDGRARTPLKTLRELVQKNYTFYTFPVLRDMLSESKLINIHYVDVTKDPMDKLMDKLATDSAKFVLTSFGTTARSFNLQNRGTRKHISILPEKLLTAQLTLYMRRHSYLKHRIDELLIHILSAGIIDKFESYYLDSSLDRRKTPHQPVKLSLALLFGLVSVYFILLFISLLVFLFELLSTKSPLIRRGLEFINC